VSPRAKKEKESKSNSLFTVIFHWFTEARQYLVAFSAAIVAFGVLHGQIARIDWTNWIADIVAVIPPLLVFVCQTLPRLIKQRRERVFIKSAEKEAAKPQISASVAPYFLIGPYGEERRGTYARADNMHRTVLDWLRKTDEQILILTGSSGTGKSSLLNAFVIPELRESKPAFTVLLVRSFDNPLDDLRRQLLAPGNIWDRSSDENAKLPLNQLIGRAVTRLRKADPKARLVVVFDQFEELIILQTERSAAVGEVTAFLRELRQARIDGFVLLLSMRFDYRIFLEQLGVPPLNHGQNWQDIPAFTFSYSVQFITAPKSGLRIAEERLKRVLTEAAAVDGTRGLIRPIILNMLGLVLGRIADSPAAERPTRSLLASDLISVVNHKERKTVARAILAQMLTEADTKRPRRIGDLRSATGLEPQVILGCLLDLQLSGYARQISRPEEILDRVWEVSHDFVARLLGPILKNPFDTFSERFGRVFYPLSGVAWVLVAGSLIFAGPWLDRKFAESQLENRYGFTIQETGGGYELKEQNRDFDDLSSAYLHKLDPIVLDLPDCTSLTSVDGLKDLKNLQILNLSRWSSLINVDGLKDLKNLQILNLSDCYSLTSVDGLKDLKNLQILSFSGCESLTSVDGLKDLKNLQHLNFSGCPSLTSVDGLKDLKNLRDLDLSECKSLTSADRLKDLKNLQFLNLSRCKNLTSVDGLKDLKNLQDLSLSECESLTSIDGLKDLKNLQSLNFYRTISLTSVDGLKDLKNLQSLSLSWCNNLTNVDGLKDLKNLRYLNLSKCNNLTNVDGLKDLKNLGVLDLSECKSLISIDGLKDLKNLENLILSGCESLTGVDALKDLNNLRMLNFSGCKSLTSVDGLKNLKNLLKLCLSECKSLTNVDGLKDLGNLYELNLSNCPQLANVDGLKELQNLRTLKLTECESLTSVDGLKKLKNLQTLDLSGCSQLQDDAIKELHKQLAQTQITYR
jgi:Leucine-rich repeat (LRR) protein